MQDSRLQIIRQVYDEFITKYEQEGKQAKADALRDEKLTAIKVNEDTAIGILNKRDADKMKYAGRVSILAPLDNGQYHVLQVIDYNPETREIHYAEDNGQDHTTGYGKIDLGKIAKVHGEYVFVLQESVVKEGKLEGRLLSEKEQKEVQEVGGNGSTGSSTGGAQGGTGNAGPGGNGPTGAGSSGPGKGRGPGKGGKNTEGIFGDNFYFNNPDNSSSSLYIGNTDPLVAQSMQPASRAPPAQGQTSSSPAIDASLQKLFQGVYNQKDLVDPLYWGIISRIADTLLAEAQEGNLTQSDIQEICSKGISELHDILAQHAKDDYERARLQQSRENILQQIKNGSPQQAFATVMAAFIGSQANDGYVAIFFPRDMALCYPTKRFLDAAAGKSNQAGLYYISRNNFAYYSWMANMIDNIASHTTNNPQKFLEEFKNSILAEMKNNESFRKAIDNIKKELDELGYSELTKVRFVDSGFKTFPLMMQALFGIFYPKCETKSLAIASSVWALEQLNIETWPSDIAAAIKKNPNLAQYAVPSLGTMESVEDFLVQPFKYDSSVKGMVPTALHEQLFAFWYQIAFVLGAIAYNNLVKGISNDLGKHGVEEQQVADLTHQAVQAALNTVEVEDQNTGAKTSVMVTLTEEAKPAESAESKAQAKPVIIPVAEDIAGKVERKLQEKVPGFRLSDETKKSLEDLAANKKAAGKVFIAEAQAKKAANNDKTPRNNKTLKSILNSRVTKIIGIILAVILLFFLLRSCGPQKHIAQQVTPDTTVSDTLKPVAPEKPAKQHPVLIGQHYGHRFVFDSVKNRYYASVDGQWSEKPSKAKYTVSGIAHDATDAKPENGGESVNLQDYTRLYNEGIDKVAHDSDNTTTVGPNYLIHPNDKVYIGAIEAPETTTAAPAASVAPTTSTTSVNSAANQPAAQHQIAPEKSFLAKYWLPGLILVGLAGLLGFVPVLYRKLHKPAAQQDVKADNQPESKAAVVEAVVDNKIAPVAPVVVVPAAVNVSEDLNSSKQTDNSNAPKFLSQASRNKVIKFVNDLTGKNKAQLEEVSSNLGLLISGLKTKKNNALTAAQVNTVKAYLSGIINSLHRVAAQKEDAREAANTNKATAPVAKDGNNNLPGQDLSTSSETPKTSSPIEYIGKVYATDLLVRNGIGSTTNSNAPPVEVSVRSFRNTTKGGSNGNHREDSGNEGSNGRVRKSVRNTPPKKQHP